MGGASAKVMSSNWPEKGFQARASHAAPVMVTEGVGSRAEASLWNCTPVSSGKLLCAPRKSNPRNLSSPGKPSPHPCISPGAADTPALLLPPRVESTNEQQLMQTHRSDRFPPPAAGPAVTGAAGGALRGLQERGEEGGSWREAEAGRQDAGLSLSELCGGPPDALITPACKSTLQPRMCL